MSSAVPVAVLMCHAPIVLPEVARSEAPHVAASTRAMRATAERLVAHRPDVLVIVSPHTPRRHRSWGLVDQPELVGDFGRFGSPEVGLCLPVAHDALDRIAAEPVPTHRMRSGVLDHGALVPLHFVYEAGWRGPTALIALPWPGTGSEVAMGEAIARAAEGQRWAFLASGDLSHRLIPGAPAGYHPAGAAFDAAFVERITAGDLRGAVAIDPSLREHAAEDVVDSVAVAAGAVGFDSSGHETLAYEGPFGVGYLEAVLHEG